MATTVVLGPEWTDKRFQIPLTTPGRPLTQIYAPALVSLFPKYRARRQGRAQPTSLSLSLSTGLHLLKPLLPVLPKKRHKCQTFWRNICQKWLRLYTAGKHILKTLYLMLYLQTIKEEVCTFSGSKSLLSSLF